MGGLDVWGAIAASFLLIQCVVFNLVFVALALGFWWITRFMREKTAFGLQKAQEGMQVGHEYSLKGQSYLAAPFIRFAGRIARLRAIRKKLKG